MKYITKYETPGLRLENRPEVMEAIHVVARASDSPNDSLTRFLAGLWRDSIEINAVREDKAILLGEDAEEIIGLLKQEAASGERTHDQALASLMLSSYMDTQPVPIVDANSPQVSLAQVAMRAA